MPTRSSASERTCTRRFPICTRNARRRAASGTRRMPHGPPHVEAPGEGARRWADEQHLKTTYCHRDRYATQETNGGRVDRRRDHILKRRARDVVAARAGIRLAHASQTPLTRPFVRNAQPRRPSIAHRNARWASQCVKDNRRVRTAPTGAG